MNLVQLRAFASLAAFLAAALALRNLFYRLLRLLAGLVCGRRIVGFLLPTKTLYLVVTFLNLWTISAITSSVFATTKLLPAQCSSTGRSQFKNKEQPLAR